VSDLDHKDTRPPVSQTAIEAALIMAASSLLSALGNARRPQDLPRFPHDPGWKKARQLFHSLQDAPRRSFLAALLLEEEGRLHQDREASLNRGTRPKQGVGAVTHHQAGVTKVGG